MIDRHRTLAKLAELDGYLAELRSVMPATYQEYRTVEKRRSCERLLQLSIEAAVAVCSPLVVGLRLGLPGEENDLFEKLADRGVITRSTADLLRRMKGMRNILVPEYGRVDDMLIFDTVAHRLGDVAVFKSEILAFLSNP